MKLLKFIPYLLVAISIVSCAPAGFDRGKLRERLKGQKMEITDKDIKKVYSIKPQIKYPFRLAVYFDQKYTYYSRSRQWWNSPNDKAMLENLERELKADGIISDLVVISDSIVQSPSLKDIRLAAARFQADTVLVVRSIGDIDRYYNPLSALYITIIGYWIFPGSHYDAIFLMDGALWDVGNEYLYLTVSAEGESEMDRPGGFIESKEIILQAKDKAVVEFYKELLQRLRNIKGMTF